LVLKDAGAIKRLSSINEALQRVAAEAASLKAALTEAERRAEAAQADELAARRRAKAEQALPIAERLAERGRKMDAAVAAYVAEFTALRSDIEELAKLGVSMPSRDLVSVNLRRAHDTAFRGLDRNARAMRSFELIHSFEKLAAAWAEPGLKWLSGKLNKTAAKSAA
jgi:hypothetical protein